VSGGVGVTIGAAGHRSLRYAARRVLCRHGLRRPKHATPALAVRSFFRFSRIFQRISVIFSGLFWGQFRDFRFLFLDFSDEFSCHYSRFLFPDFFFYFLL
jgi:hypothetical protein